MIHWPQKLLSGLHFRTTNSLLSFWNLFEFIIWFSITQHNGLVDLLYSNIPSRVSLARRSSLNASVCETVVTAPLFSFEKGWKKCVSSQTVLSRRRSRMVCSHRVSLLRLHGITVKYFYLFSPFINHYNCIHYFSRGRDWVEEDELYGEACMPNWWLLRPVQDSKFLLRETLTPFRPLASTL